MVFFTSKETLLFFIAPYLNPVMTDFSQKRFVDLGQTLYVEWMKTATNLSISTEEERRMVFKMGAQYAFEAAEEFAEVFRHQEDN
jgi:hypothetical protein